MGDASASGVEQQADLTDSPSTGRGRFMAIIEFPDPSRGKLSTVRSDALELAGALLAAAIVLAVFMLLASIDPATWTLQSNTGSHLRSELWKCLAIPGDAARLSCYDELARLPAPHPGGGANIPVQAFSKPKAP